MASKRFALILRVQFKTNHEKPHTFSAGDLASFADVIWARQRTSAKEATGDPVSLEVDLFGGSSFSADSCVFLRKPKESHKLPRKQYGKKEYIN